MVPPPFAPPTNPDEIDLEDSDDDTVGGGSTKAKAASTPHEAAARNLALAMQNPNEIDIDDESDDEDTQPAGPTEPMQVQAQVPEQRSSLVSDLAQLASLHKDGALTPEEFTAAKAAAIASHTGANKPAAVASPPVSLLDLPPPSNASNVRWNVRFIVCIE